MELSEIEVHEVVVPLHLRESVEDGRHPIYTASSQSGNQENVREHILSMPAFHSLLTGFFFLVYHEHSDRPVWP
jgi:hypothetical protein